MPSIGEVEYLPREFVVLYLQQCGEYGDADGSTGSRELRERLMNVLIQTMTD
jgi:hypothetical protein